MTIQQKIMNDIKSAMKANDTLRKNVLRMVLSDIKYAQAAVNVHQELDEASAMKVVAGYHKKLKKAFEEFPEGEKKQELIKEITIVEEYLPKMLSDQELEEAVQKVLAATSSRNFGELMKAVLSQVGSSADAKAVSEKIKKSLEHKSN